MKNILYTLLAVLSFCLVQARCYAQQTDTAGMKQKIIKSLSVSEKRAEEIHKALSYNQKEIYQVLSARKPNDKEQMARLRQLVRERQVYIAGALTADELAKLETLVSPEVRQRKAAALQKIQMVRQQQGSPVNKMN